jgi:hypothetical protein
VYEGLVGLGVLGVVAVSSVRNTAFLTVAPRWARGILRFAHDRGSLDFTKVVPVLLTNLVLIALGVQAAGEDPAAWPFAVGPVLSLLLNAWPSAKVGMCACACVRACRHAHVCVRACMHACMHVCVFLLGRTGLGGGLLGMCMHVRLQERRLAGG